MISSINGSEWAKKVQDLKPILKTFHVAPNSFFTLLNN